MILDLFKLDGKVAIVTGAATGIGQGVAIALAEAGANILAIGHETDMEETKEAVESRGRKFAGLTEDLKTLEPVSRIISTAVKEFGKIDILVNNAGIIRRMDAIDYSEKDWDDVISINLKTLFFLSQAAARQFIKQGTGGKIINIASMLSYQGGIRVPAYTAAKSGVMGITRALANEWARYNINVNAIAPGYIETNNTMQLRNDSKRYNEILGRIPAGRWGQPEDIMGAAVFLASEASDYVNGFTVAVDGGWLAR